MEKGGKIESLETKKKKGEEEGKKGESWHAKYIW